MVTKKKKAICVVDCSRRPEDSPLIVARLRQMAEFRGYKVSIRYNKKGNLVLKLKLDKNAQKPDGG